MENNEQVEKMVKDYKLTAPRVSLQDVKDNIKQVEYVEHVTPTGSVLRWCVLTTRNGFSVTGKPSAAVSKENDNQEIGEKVAYDNAFAEMWPLMGYAIKEALWVEQQKEELILIA